MNIGTLIPSVMHHATFKIKRMLGQQTFSRVYKRYNCCIISKLILLERGVPLDGLTVDISVGGALFREATKYILNRQGMEVVLELGDLKLDGTITFVSAKGYGVRFLDVLDEAKIAPVIEKYGVAT
jgi:hypothetical protein